MNLLQEHADRELLRQAEDIARLARARLEKPQTDPSLLPRLILAAEDRVARDFPGEFDRSFAIAEELGRPPTPGCVYLDRALVAGTAAAGGYLVGIDVPPVFGESALDPGLIDRLGVQRIPMGPDGQIPKVTAGVTTAWLSNETTNATESTPTFDAANVTPKRCGGYFQVSRQLLTQTSRAAAALLSRELPRAVNHAVAAALIAGGGTEEPVGIVGTSGVTDAGGTSIDWDAVTDILAAVEDAGEVTRGGWAMAADVAKILRTREKATGSGMILSGGFIDAYPAHVSPAVPDGGLAFGDWSQVVLPEWGALEVGANPYAAVGFRAGIVQGKAIAAVDVGVLRPSSFAKSESVT